MEDDLEVVARAEDVLAHEPVVVGLGQCLGETLGAEAELAPQVDERVVGLDGEGTDHDALDQLVRIALHQHVVLERGRLAFVAVHREVAGEHVLGQERPLLAGAEPGAAAAA